MSDEQQLPTRAKRLRGRFEMCPARRVHAVSTDYYVACSREPGHEGEHLRGETTWTDDHRWACRDGEGEPLDWRARSEHGLRSCTTDTCNGRGFIKCWNPGGICPTPNEPRCELCGSCNECAAERGDDDRAG